MTITLEHLENVWHEVVRSIRHRDRMLEAVLRSVRPIDVARNKVTLSAASSFHKKQVLEEHNRSILEEALSGSLGESVGICGVKFDGIDEMVELKPEPITSISPLDNPEVMLSTLAELFMHEGAQRELVILADAQGKFEFLETDWGEDYYRFFISTPLQVFVQIRKDIDQIQEIILDQMRIITQSESFCVREVCITPKIKDNPDWRDSVRSYLRGSGVNNQGRVRSDNIASLQRDGLLFRSKAEMNFYLAFKKTGCPFAPLPVFLRGGDDYLRIEPDFIILRDGITLMIEIDGDTYHKETPSAAHKRAKMLTDERVIVERIEARDCETVEKAQVKARELLQLIDKRKGQ